MKFGSKHTLFRVDARGNDPILHPATGSVVGHTKPLVAEFGIAGAEFIPRDKDGEALFTDESGRPFALANIRGNFYDSEAHQEEAKLSDEERDAIEQQILYFCRTHPHLVWVLTPAKVAAPWPTFDTQSDKNRVAFAIEGGMVSEALNYARQEGREKVVSELEAYLSEREADSEAQEALTVA